MQEKLPSSKSAEDSAIVFLREKTQTDRAGILQSSPEVKPKEYYSQLHAAATELGLDLEEIEKGVESLEEKTRRIEAAVQVEVYNRRDLYCADLIMHGQPVLETTKSLEKLAKSPQDWAKLGQEFKRDQADISNHGLEIEKLGLSGLLTNARVTIHHDQGSNSKTLRVRDLKAGWDSDMLEVGFAQLESSPSDQDDRVERYQIEHLLEQVQSGNWEFEKDGLELNSLVAEKLDRLVEKNELSRYYRMAMEEIESRDALRNPYHTFEDLKWKQHEKFYRQYAQIIPSYEKILTDSTNLERAWRELRQLLAASDALPSEVIGFLKTTAARELVNRRVRDQVYREQVEGETQDQDDLRGPEHRSRELIFDWPLPVGTNFSFEDDGSVVVTLPDEFFESTMSFHGRLTGAYYLSKESMVRAFSYELIVSRKPYSESTRDHEQEHRYNLMRSPETKALTSGVFSQTRAVLEEPGNKDLLGAMKRDLADYNRFIKDEILAFAQDVKNGRLDWSVVSERLTRNNSLYDRVDQMLQGAKIQPSEAFEMAFVAAPKLDFEEAWSDLWREKTDQIRKWIEVYRTVDDHYLMVAVPIKEWENLIEK